MVIGLAAMRGSLWTPLGASPAWLCRASLGLLWGDDDRSGRWAGNAYPTTAVSPHLCKLYSLTVLLSHNSTLGMFSVDGEKIKKIALMLLPSDFCISCRADN